MTKLEIISIGDSLGIILPKELLAQLNANEGDMLLVKPTSHGIALTVCYPKLARQIEVARKVMCEERETLRKLADS